MNRFDPLSLPSHWMTILHEKAPESFASLTVPAQCIHFGRSNQEPLYSWRRINGFERANFSKTLTNALTEHLKEIVASPNHWSKSHPTVYLRVYTESYHDQWANMCIATMEKIHQVVDMYTRLAERLLLDVDKDRTGGFDDYIQHITLSPLYNYAMSVDQLPTIYLNDPGTCKPITPSLHCYIDDGQFVSYQSCWTPDRIKKISGHSAKFLSSYKDLYRDVIDRCLDPLHCSTSRSECVVMSSMVASVMPGRWRISMTDFVEGGFLITNMRKWDDAIPKSATPAKPLIERHVARTIRSTVGSMMKASANMEKKHKTCQAFLREVIDSYRDQCNHTVQDVHPGIVLCRDCRKDLTDES